MDQNSCTIFKKTNETLSIDGEMDGQTQIRITLSKGSVLTKLLFLTIYFELCTTYHLESLCMTGHA